MRAALLFLLTGALLAGCGRTESLADPPKAQVVGQETLEETEEQETGPSWRYPVLSSRGAEDGQVRSYLTGETVPSSVGNRRPIAVMIPNNKAAQPQYGLSRASVVYEACVEGRITRLMGIFEAFDDLDHIGPVRSSRDYFVYTALEYDAIYCHWGLAVPYVAELLNSDGVDNISQANKGVDVPSPVAFDRISRPGYATEFTGYLFIDGLKKAVEQRGYPWEYEDGFTPKFTFAADGVTADYGDEPDAQVLCPGESGSRGGYGGVGAAFTYDPADGLYYRSQYGSGHTDELTGRQLAVKNVVFQYCHGEVRDSHDYLAFGVHGEGDCIVFTNGKMIRGRWTRYGGDASPAKYYDEEGREIVFNQGKTWVCGIWEEYADAVRIDGAPVERNGNE
ncbi:MAG: DUF3048 domain-containing protein [Eubacteriales bacterium]|nr:DUF3048 domain-containing protein [Eubacteriales bacterium]